MWPRSTRRCAGCTPPVSERRWRRRQPMYRSRFRCRRPRTAAGRRSRSVRPRRVFRAERVQRRPLPRHRQVHRRHRRPRHRAPAPSTHGPRPAEPVVITGAALGLPGTDHVFDDANVGRILARPAVHRRDPARGCASAILDKHITRLVKSEDGGPRSRPSTTKATSSSSPAAAAPSTSSTEFGIDPDRDAALDARDPARDRRRHRRAPRRRHPARACATGPHSIGTRTPGSLGAPRALRDDTGVVFASAFPGYGEFADDSRATTRPRAARPAGAAGRGARARGGRRPAAAPDLDRRIRELRAHSRDRAVSRSTAASCSACSRWATRSSPSSSAPAARTPR